MRILYFSSDYGPHDHRFLTALAGTSNEIYYLRLLNGTHQDEDRSVPPKVHQLGSAGSSAVFRWRDIVRYVLNVRRVVREVKPDLIHAGPIQTCALIAVLSGFRPVLTMSWGFDLMQDADRNAWWRWVTRYALNRSAYFVSDARVTRSKAIDLGMRRDRTAVFPWGVDLQHFSPGRRKDRRASRSQAADKAKPRLAPRSTKRQPFVLLCNRSWEPRYGVDVLGRAFAQVAREAPAVSLLLLGGGSQANALRGILAEAEARGRVHYGGHVSQSALPGYYRNASLFISPSHVDGSSVSLMEALACGTPVLVSDIPANREWVRDGANGWLFRDGDADDLKRKILWIAHHRRLLPSVSHEARKVAEARADWKKNFQVLLRSYDATISAG